MNWKTITLILLLAATLFIAIAGLLRSNQAYQLALSDIELEEQNTLMTPVYDETTESWSFLAIYKVGITNQGPLDLKLNSVEKIVDSGGFLIPLKGHDIVDVKLSHNVFVVEPAIAEIKQNPRLIKSLTEKRFENSADLDLLIETGQSKTVRIGVMVDAYDADKNPLAQVILMSLKFKFDNGKIRVFRRGFPVHPLQ